MIKLNIKLNDTYHANLYSWYKNINLNTYSHTKVKYIYNNIKLNDTYHSINDSVQNDIIHTAILIKYKHLQ